jgi:hypothetical protein
MCLGMPNNPVTWEFEGSSKQLSVLKWRSHYYFKTPFKNLIGSKDLYRQHAAFRWINLYLEVKVF